MELFLADLKPHGELYGVIHLIKVDMTPFDKLKNFTEGMPDQNG
jgi:hypothetical protein